jgi:hypothetical protein
MQMHLAFQSMQEAMLSPERCLCHGQTMRQNEAMTHFRADLLGRHSGHSFCRVPLTSMLTPFHARHTRPAGASRDKRTTSCGHTDQVLQ